MFYSFNLCDDNSLDLVLSGSQLYSVENDNKKRETDLDERERFVLEFLINNSSVDNPISLNDPIALTGALNVRRLKGSRGRQRFGDCNQSSSA